MNKQDRDYAIEMYNHVRNLRKIMNEISDRTYPESKYPSELKRDISTHPELKERLINRWYNDLWKNYNRYQNSTEYKMYWWTDEQIDKKNRKEMEKLLIEAWEKVLHICGDVTSARRLTLTVGNNNYPVLNGVIEGKKGIAKIESVYAGGYNVQRLHVRVLVKPLK